MRKFLLLIFLFILFGLVDPFRLRAQNTLTPKYSNDFLSIGVGARALGMAGAQAAIANDVTAAYWNPAGLLGIEDKFQASLMHAEYFGGIASYDYAGFATKLDESGRIAFSLIRMGIDNIPDTRFLIDNNGAINYNNVGSFAEASYAFMFSYARYSTLLDGLKTGANVKVIHRTAGIFANSWGFGIDVGAQLDLKQWRFGLVGRDITSTFNIWNYNTDAVIDIFSQTGNEIPNNSIELTLPRVIAEIGRKMQFSETFGMLLSAGMNFTFDGRRNTLLQSNLISGDFQAGLELNYRNIAFVRGGLGNYQQLQNFDQTTYTEIQRSIGAGFVIKNFTIDYALANFGSSDALLNSHVFSVKAGFDALKQNKK